MASGGTSHESSSISTMKFIPISQATKGLLLSMNTVSQAPGLRSFGAKSPTGLLSIDSRLACPDVLASVVEIAFHRYSREPTVRGVGTCAD